MSTPPAPSSGARTPRIRGPVLAHARFEVTGALRNGEQLLVALVLPALVLVGLGVVDVVAVPVPAGSTRIDVVAPGVLALALVSSSFTSLAISTAFERRWGVLRQLATTPLGPRGIILGKSLGVLALAVGQAIVLGAASLVLDWRPDPVGLLLALPFAALGIAAFAALALLIAGTLRAEAVLAVGNLLWVLLAAGGALVLPADALPTGLAALTRALPSGALGEGMRTAMTTGHVAWTELTVLAAWALGLGLAARRWFRPSE